MNKKFYLKKIITNIPFLKKYIKITYKNICKIINLKYVPSIYGPKLKSNWCDGTFQFCIFGSYGYFLSDFIKKINYKFYFLDIGANQGIYSLLAAKNLNCDKVFAFEPTPETFKLLQENIYINKFLKKIIPFQAVICDKNGQLELTTFHNHSGGSSITPRIGKKNFKNKILVNSYTRCELNKLNFKKLVPIIIKIDTEGSEPQIINELVKTNFIEDVNHIFFECNDNYTDYEDMKKVLQANGFNYFEKTSLGEHYDVLASR